jgi:hypothetical protein
MAGAGPEACALCLGLQLSASTLLPLWARILGTDMEVTPAGHVLLARDPTDRKTLVHLHSLSFGTARRNGPRRA